MPGQHDIEDFLSSTDLSSSSPPPISYRTTKRKRSQTDANSSETVTSDQSNIPVNSDSTNEVPQFQHIRKSTKRKRLHAKRLHAVYAPDDPIDRCPMCLWELVERECAGCGRHIPGDSLNLASIACIRSGNSMGSDYEEEDDDDDNESKTESQERVSFGERRDSAEQGEPAKRIRTLERRRIVLSSEDEGEDEDEDEDFSLRSPGTACG